MSTEILINAAKIGDVNTIVIVDDAYDPPKPSEITENAFNQFVQLTEGNLPQEELKKHCGLDEENLDDWSDFQEEENLIISLWNVYVGANSKKAISQETKEALKKLFDDVSLDRRGKLAQLASLEKLLEELDRKLIRLGSDSDPQIVARADVVFLDLYLSEEIPQKITPDSPVPKSAFEKARERALNYLKKVRSVTESYDSGVAPAFILISSQGSDKKADNFRIKSGQMKSRFRFIKKQDLNDKKPHAVFAISDIFRTCGACSIVEPILKAWPRVLGDAEKWIQEKLNEMDISDFGHLYNLKLNKEGEPIEEYIKELIAGALAEKVCCSYNSLKLPRKVENPFDSLTYYYETPSNAFAKLYAANKISQDRGFRGQSNFDPRGGDIFLDGRLPKLPTTSLEGRKIFSVMSPSCDLIERPGNGANSSSILCLEGKICSPLKVSGEPQIFSFHERNYHIKWEFKQPLTISMENIKMKWKLDQITWLGRLKADHFLSLQSEYLNDLGRVGLVKPPSVYEVLEGKIVVKIGKRRVTLEEFKIEDSFAFLCTDHSKAFEAQSVIFSGSFIQRFSEIIDENKDKEELSQIARDKLNGLKERIEKIIDMREKNNAKTHSIQRYLTVELHQSKDIEIKEGAAGVVVVCLWPVQV